MGFTLAAKQTMLDYLGDNFIDEVSLHNGAPGETGTNEISGGSPAYARKAVTFNAASSDNKTFTASLVFDVPGSTTVSYVGFWGGSPSTFQGWDQLTTPEVFGSQGTFTLDVTSRLRISD